MKKPSATRPRCICTRQLLRTLAAVLFLMPGLGAGQTLFFDDFESGLAGWTANGSWGLTTARHHSPSRSVSDSPGAFYSNNSDTRLTLAAAVDLSAIPRPVLVFHHGHVIEAGYDFGRVEVSTDGGANWLAEPLAAYTGVLPGMVREQLVLGDHAAATDLKIRFRMVTDHSIVMEGWYLDDVRIANAPEPVALATPTAGDLETNAVTLRWTAPSEPDFAERRILRLPQGVFDWRAARVVGVIDDPAVLEFTDITVAPKSHYQYAVMTLTTDDTHSLSNLAGATTPSGMDYPFLDNGEAGPGYWVATPPWALTDEDFYSPGHAWADSPGGNYADNISSQPLTLAAPFSLADAENPVLTFRHRYTLAAGDLAAVEISTNLGASWATLQSYATGTVPWRQVRLPLAAYVGQPSVLLRFRLSTDVNHNAEGWYLDDISVAEAPGAIPAPAIDQIASHSLRLTWASSPDEIFSHYAIHRSMSPDVGIHSPLAGTVADREAPEFIDSGLALDTVYYYRVYAVSPYGTYSADSAIASDARTLNNPIPFTDDFTGPLGSWNLEGSWGTTTTHSHSGGVALTDSPEMPYAINSNTSATTAVDLRGSAWPVLRFHERYDFGTGDRGYLEVSTNGTSWSAIYSVSGGQSEWEEAAIDLSHWKNQANLRIRFRLQANHDASVGDGWFIDSVSIDEHVSTPQALPLRDDFTGALSDTWLTGGWSTRADAEAIKGGSVLGDSSDDAPWSDMYLSLGRELDLTDAADPQLVFWYRGFWARYHYLNVQISENGGLSWANAYVAGTTSSSGANFTNWTRHQQSLAAYAGKTIRLRLWNQQTGSAGATHTGRIDAFAVMERPVGVVQHAPVPAVRSVALSWEPSLIGNEFARYEIYRHTAANVSPGHTLVFQSDAPATTTFTDTGLIVGQTYFYSVFVVNNDEVYSIGSERSTTTIPVGFPYSDEMNDLAQWMPEGQWGIAEGSGREGGNALASNPTGDYEIYENTSAFTAVDLSGSAWPVLRFHQRFDFGTGDRGYLEVSTSGTSWAAVYSISGQQSDWKETAIDLSQWRNQANLRIRFRLQANHDASVGDGWFIDSVTIAEHVSTPQSLPLRDDFTGALDENWLTGGWSTRADGEAIKGDRVLGDSSDDTPWSDLYLNLGRELDLTDAVDPQLVFWYRGFWARYHYLNVQISENGGLSWANAYVAGTTSSSGANFTSWTRHQQSLAAYAGKTIRLRLWNQQTGSAGATHTGRIDAFAVMERPVGVVQHAPAPSVRSVALLWEPSTIGTEFARYEIYRHTGANVSPGHTLVFQSDDPATTTFTDTGLSVGQTYFYSVFVVNQDEIYAIGSERSTTTIPVGFPYSDEMNDLAQWMPEGEWGIAEGSGREGGNALASNPTGDYGAYENTSAFTAVDLSGSAWPVLRIHERFDFGTGDRGYLEVSTNGTSWAAIYSVSGQEPDWQETAIDLSHWKNQANLRIRFRLQANHDASVGDGWFIDSVTIAEHVTTPQSLPLRDDFAGALADNWLTGGWSTRADGEAIKGGRVLGDSIDDAPWSDLYLNLRRELDLTDATDPQLVFWYRGFWARYHYLNVQISENGGLSWVNTYVAGTTSSSGANFTNWTRHQQSLAAYAGKTIRLRLWHQQTGSAGATHTGRIDALAVMELHPAATLQPIESVTTASIAIDWTQPAIDGFAAYRVYRAAGPNVTEASTLVAEITDPGETTFTDTGLQARTTYHYRVFTVNEDGLSVGSNTVSASTLAVVPPWHEDFAEGLQDNWTTTGTWQVAALGENGAPALVDAIGDYLPSSHTTAQTAIDLSGMAWPVLVLRDRYHLGSGDFAYVEVSINNGSTWIPIHALRDSRTTWADTRIDLSPFRQADSLWLRFRLQANSDASVGDGWRIASVAVVENEALPASTFYDDFSGSPDSWINGGWAPAEVDGRPAMRNTAWNSNYGGNDLMLAHEIEVPEEGGFLLTCWLRAQLASSYGFVIQVSGNGGINWITLPGTSFSNTTIGEWTRLQVNLAGYAGQNLRLRLRTDTGTTWRTGFAAVSRIGIGPVEPAAPVLLWPTLNETVTIVRPTLVVQNAIDYQSDSLFHQFEVYGDEALTQLVAQVPSVASGAASTSWEVDVDLPDNAPYWWRARAIKGEILGPWSEAIGFNLNEFNNPPLAVAVAGPANDSLMLDGNGLLLWYQTSDPDPGDVVLDYHIQISADSGFTDIAVNATGIVVAPEVAGPGQLAAYFLGDLPGGAELPSGRWFWRIRARDQRFSSGPWSEGFAYFRLPTFYQRHLRQIYPDPDWFLYDVSDPNADPDGNGVGVLMEFAIGIAPGEDPGDRLPRPINVWQQDAMHQGFEWTSRKLHELDYRLESSTNLRTWSRVPDASLEVLHDIDADAMRVRIVDPLPVGTWQRRFVRLAVGD